MKVLSIANFKGGTGKTVTACNFAAILAEEGHRVLLIDADPQHNASTFFGAGDTDAPTLFDVLSGYCEPVAEDNLSPAGRENLEILPGDMRLLQLDLAAIADGSSEAVRRFRDFLDALRDDGEIETVIIDCPPSFTAASVAALLESDDVIMPTRVDAFSRDGVTELIQQIRNIGKTAAGLRFSVLVTMANRTNLSRQGAQLLRQSGLPVMGIEIREAVAVGESTYVRQPLIDYAPRATATMDYRAAVKEYLQEVKNYGEAV